MENEISFPERSTDTRNPAKSEKYYYKKWKEARNKLEEFKKFYFEQLDHFPHPAMIWENTGNNLILVNANLPFRNLTKGNIQNYIGKTPSELWNDEPDLINYLKLSSGKKEHISVEYNYLFNTGEPRKDVLLTFNYLPPNRISMFAEDMTLFKSAEKIVDEKEQELDRIIENLPVSVAILSYTGRIIKLNQKFTETFGYARDQLPTIAEFFQLIYPDDSKKQKAARVLPKLITRAYKQNLSLQPVILKLRCNNNSYCFSEIKINIIGEYSLVTFNDITSLIESQKAMKQSSDIIESIQTGMYIYHLEDIHDDRTLRLLKVNPASVLQTGRNTYKAVGKTIDEAFPYLRELGIPKKFARVIRTGKSKEFEEIRYLDDENTERIYSLKAFPLPDQHLGVSFENITNKKKAEEDLKASEEKFRLMAENASDIIFQTDSSLRFTYLSPAIKKILQYDPSELQETYIWDLLHPDSRNFVARRLEILQNEWREGNFDPKSENTEIEIIRKDGKTIWAELRGSAILNNKNEVVGINGICRDISERKAAEQEIREALEKAEESDKLKTAFLANISHEIRTPLNGILGFAGMLEKPELKEEKRQQFVKFIQSSGTQLLKIITDIVDLSKIEAGQVKIMKRDTNLNILFSNLLTQIEQEKSESNKKEIRINMKLGSEAPDYMVEADDIRLKQILGGLLNNALKFTEQGHIEFGYDISHPDKLLFYVKDTGVGISKEKQQEIFNRFQQEDNSFTRKFGGTGLGLSICKGLIELMGGEIWVESEKNKGANFYFTIPCNVTRKENEPVKIQETETTYDWKGKNLLIVEDEQITAEYLKIILEETGIAIQYAGNGQEAVDKCLSDSSIDLVLMDMRLPVMDGYDATRLIRSARADLPIIAQTANALPKDKIMALEAGCNDFVTKPIDRALLLNLMNRYLTNAKQLSPSSEKDKE